jgi:hypothetical protein
VSVNGPITPEHMALWNLLIVGPPRACVVTRIQLETAVPPGELVATGIMSTGLANFMPDIAVNQNLLTEIRETVSIMIDREMAEGRLPTDDTSDIRCFEYPARMYTELWYEGRCVLSWRVVVSAGKAELVFARGPQEG